MKLQMVYVEQTLQLRSYAVLLSNKTINTNKPKKQSLNQNNKHLY